MDLELHLSDGHTFGAHCQNGKTVFRLWAPTASQVLLRLYQDGSAGTAFRSIPLQKVDQGVWLWESESDLDGHYYDYQVTVDGVARDTADPYARACGLNGTRSMVLNLCRTDPPLWQEDVPPPLQPETILYELHIKDFSWASSGGFPTSYQGKYKAFSCVGTTLYGDGLHPTGIDYLKRLGVTHVQLMPVFDFDQVEEDDPEQYNWGYNPLNYNVPEGSYATDPAHGEVRIREFKEMVQALHKNGFRVVMDVVYNHTGRQDSWLERTVPGYYYRKYPDGIWSNGSGCGNDLASERPMCRRYLVESVLYWAEEYHIDGFRFDLMGLLDTQTMEEIRTALDFRWGRGEKLIYGEPWTAGESPMEEGFRGADKNHLAELDVEIGAFCDHTRDIVKGSALVERASGFVNGASTDLTVLFHCAAAWCGPWSEYIVHAPSQVITYLSCHDNQTLWDKLVLTMSPSNDYDEFPAALLQANRLAAAICFTCQGRPFLLSGEEFARTKYGCSNSYQAPAVLNQLDWERAWKNEDLVNYYRGLIALRKQLPGLCDKSPQAWQRIHDEQILSSRCISFRVSNQSGSRWSELLVVWNGDNHSVSVPLGPGHWQTLCNGTDSFYWRREQFVETAETEASPVSALILGRVEEAKND